jgi:hypothetical protein
LDERTDLKARGVNDIFITATDNLKGFTNAMLALQLRILISVLPFCFNGVNYKNFFFRAAFTPFFGIKKYMIIIIRPGRNIFINFVHFRGEELVLERCFKSKHFRAENLFGKNECRRKRRTKKNT